jgi:hypothetical protein
VILALAIAFVGTRLIGDFVSSRTPAIDDAADLSDVLYVHKTAIENIIVDENSGTGYVNNELLFTVGENVSKSDVENAISATNGTIVGYDKYLSSYQVQLSKNYTRLIGFNYEIQVSGLILSRAARITLYYLIVLNRSITDRYIIFSVLQYINSR